MSATFSQFCTASQAGYSALRQCIDLCARQERSYEFPDCLMPDGCVPERALLGFSRQRDGSYLLYWRPAVDYHGASRVLTALFRRNLWRFQSSPLCDGSWAVPPRQPQRGRTGRSRVCA